MNELHVQTRLYYLSTFFNKNQMKQYIFIYSGEV
jgi:hypothetical protein